MSPSNLRSLPAKSQSRVSMVVRENGLKGLLAMAMGLAAASYAAEPAVALAANDDAPQAAATGAAATATSTTAEAGAGTGAGTSAGGTAQAEGSAAPAALAPAAPAAAGEAQSVSEAADKAELEQRKAEIAAKVRNPTLRGHLLENIDVFGKNDLPAIYILGPGIEDFEGQLLTRDFVRDPFLMQNIDREEFEMKMWLRSDFDDGEAKKKKEDASVR